MTKAKILRDYFKKFYNVDSEGMSLVQVHKDFVKKHFNYDSNATSFISAVGELIDNDLAPDGGGSGGGGGNTDNLTLVRTLPPSEEADPNVTYARPIVSVYVGGVGGRQYAAHKTVDTDQDLTLASLPRDAQDLIHARIKWFILHSASTGNHKVFVYNSSSGEIEDANRDNVIYFEDEDHRQQMVQETSDRIYVYGNTGESLCFFTYYEDYGYSHGNNFNYEFYTNIWD